MHGILGMAEPGTCKSKTSCDCMRVVADHVAIHARVYRDSKLIASIDDAVIAPHDA
jgi:hypothetical protein